MLSLSYGPKVQTFSCLMMRGSIASTSSTVTRLLSDLLPSEISLGHCFVTTGYTGFTHSSAGRSIF